MAGAKVYGLEKVIKRLQKEFQDAAGDRVVEVTVGYKAPYAIYVHEDLEAFHPNGQAKYLEQPARQLIPSVVPMVAKIVAQKKGLKFALLAVANRLLAASQRLVPVRTGKLKRSGFVKVKVKS